MTKLEEARQKVAELREQMKKNTEATTFGEGGAKHTAKEWRELIEENNRLHEEYSKAYKLMKRLEAVEMERVHGAQDEYIKAQLKANGIEVIKIKHWNSDPKPYVEISWKHRPQLGKLQETVGDALGILFTIKM